MRRLFSFIRRYSLWIIIVATLAIIALAFEAGRYTVYKANPGLSSSEQAGAILNNVGKLIQLPQNETPTMATINDAESAKKAQPFLAQAANGDVLIVYATAQEAILYRPSSNKLIAVGPVNTTADTTQPAQTSTTQKPAATASASTSQDTASTTKR